MEDNIKFIPDEELVPIHVMQSFSQVVDWGLMQSSIPEAWKYTMGEGINVAILDTGIAEHPDMEGALLPPLNFSGENDHIDRNGHGTHCASIVAARNNELGMVGVAPGCNIISVKVLGNNGSGSYDGIIAGLQGAMDAGADIISMSLGSPTEAPNALHEKIKEATNRGIIVLAAAGNDAGRTNYPARYDEVIAVAALDRTGNLAHFSSRSDEVDAVAPGVDIYACHLNRGYAKLNGTSQACPFMAGVCALLLAWSRKTPDVPLIKNYQEMLQRLDDVCDKDSNNVALGRNGEWGFGIPSFANNKFRP